MGAKLLQRSPPESFGKGKQTWVTEKQDYVTNPVHNGSARLTVRDMQLHGRTRRGIYIVVDKI